jgi:hypothetical protein
MATRAERRAEAMRKHIEFCQERTRQLQAAQIKRLEAEHAQQLAEQEKAEQVAQERRAQFRAVR